MKKKAVLLFISLTISGFSFAQSTSSLRADGTILVNGSPFFPFGSYGVHWTSADADRIDCIQAMVDAGFNITTIEDAGNQNTIDEIITKANDNNLKLVIGTPNSPNIIYPPQKYKNNNCIFAWSLADDGDNGTWTVAELTTRNAELKSYDNSHLTFLTLTAWDVTRRGNADKYTAITDVSANQIYPIGQCKGADYTVANALTETYKRTLHYVNSAAKFNRPLLMNLQTFNWGTQSLTPRYPTVLELRNMMYSGLSAGVKGILSYDFSFDLVNNQPALWNEFKTLRNDVTALESVLLNATLIRVNTSDPELVTSYWTNNDGIYIVVVNTSYTSSKTLSLPIPLKFGPPVKSLFGRMPNTLSYSAETLSGVIAPTQVEVYFLKNLEADNDAPSVPTGLDSSSVSLTTFEVSWRASTDNIGVKGYEVFKNGLSVGSTADTSIKITGLTCGSSYTITAKAFDAAGNLSATSDSLQVVTSACSSDLEAPTIPENLLASFITDKSFVLTWEHSTDNYEVAMYYVYINENLYDSTALTSIKLVNQNPDFRYSVKVNARDASGNTSGFSDSIGVKTLPESLLFLAKESFNYPAGELAGNGLKTDGWNGPWIKSSGTIKVVQGHMTIDTVGNFITTELNSDPHYFRELDTTWQDLGHSYWISFTLKKIPSNKLSYGGLSLYNESQEMLFIGCGWQIKDSLSVGLGSQWKSIAALTAQENWVVVKLVMSSDNNYDKAFMWLNPDSTDLLDTLSSVPHALWNGSNGFNKIRIANGLEYSISLDRIELSSVPPRIPAILTSTKNIETDNFKIFPNPAKGFINLLNAGGADITIYSLQGQLLKQIKCIHNPHLINVSSLENGLYLVKIKKPEGTIIRKLEILK